jgi:hypothetical protein
MFLRAIQRNRAEARMINSMSDEDADSFEASGGSMDSFPLVAVGIPDKDLWWYTALIKYAPLEQDDVEGAAR